MPGSPGHGWFGSGVCDDPTTAGSAPACPACELKDAASVATAHVATAHLPREERGRYASWLGMGGLKLLETIVPDWVADAGHDAETFRRDNFGSDGSARTAGLAQNFAINLSGTLSGGARDTARFAAGAALAQLIQTVRPERMTREISPPAGRSGAAMYGLTGELDQRWLNTMNDALRDHRSNVYDMLIRQELTEYNRRFAGTPGFVPLDFRLFKAIPLVESGPFNPEWVAQPYQIGKKGDPGYDVLLRRAEGSALIMSPELFRDITTLSITEPRINVRAGIAYVLTRMVETRMISQVDPTDPSRRIYHVEAGDSLDRISRRLGTTIENLSQNNPGISNRLQPEQRLAYQKAAMLMIISGWRQISPASLMSRYNGNKDFMYARKIEYVMQRIP